MIEVLLPFLLMKQAPSKEAISSTTAEVKGGTDLPHVYAYFRKFVQFYIPNTMHSKFNAKGGTSLPYLKCTLILSEMLLQYHDA